MGRRAGDGQWTMGNGQWTMDNRGQWVIGNYLSNAHYSATLLVRDECPWA
ncbi:MAG: hypothetical protein LBB49_00420 [Gracilibacteraceae bacterium]|nr:hypothetical protein [Gracilibacteraceae bacterium]